MILTPDKTFRTVHEARDPSRPGLTVERVRTLLALKFAESQRGSFLDVVTRGLEFWRGVRHSSESAETPHVQEDPFERAKEDWVSGHIDVSEIDGCAVLINAILNMSIEDRRDNIRSESDSVDYSYEKEMLNFDKDDVVPVQITREVNNEPVGSIVSTTRSIANKWIAHGQARSVTLIEAMRWAKLQRDRLGGWMDDPRWRSFTSGYRRILIAFSTKPHKGGSSPPSQVAVAA